MTSFIPYLFFHCHYRRPSSSFFTGNFKTYHIRHCSIMFIVKLLKCNENEIETVSILLYDTIEMGSPVTTL